MVRYYPASKTIGLKRVVDCAQTTRVHVMSVMAQASEIASDSDGFNHNFSLLLRDTIAKK